MTNFNNIKAAEVQLKLQQIWAEPTTSKDYSPRANALTTVLENQTAVISELESSDTKRDVSVKWVDFCGDTAADGTDADTCVNEVAAEGAGKKKDYSLDIFVTDKFSVASEELESSVISYDEIVATGIAAKIKNILEKFNEKVVAAIDANKGNNPFTAQFAVDNTTNKVTTIPAASYKADSIIPYLAQVSELNRSNSTFLLDGGNLFQDYMKATANMPNADGKLAGTLYGTLPYRHDLFGFAANSVSDVSYLIDKGAMAIANRAKWPTLQQLSGAKDGGWTHTSNGNFMRYSIPIDLSSIPKMTFISQGQLIKRSLFVDVQHSVVCHSDGKLYPTWNFKLRAAVLPNPIRCTATNTGIIKLKKVAD
ncbi:MAG TPA: hypothetical protein VJ552_05365 [Sediminibacterium sp.]|nr:hypothetical protein [Sediminibacterium sp.]